MSKFRSKSLVPPPPELKPCNLPPPPPALDGIRVTLSHQPDHLTAITRHGLEIELPVTVEGMIQLHRMLQALEVPKLAPILTPIYIWAEWERIGPCGAGKLPKQRRELVSNSQSTVDPNLGL